MLIADERRYRTCVRHPRPDTVSLTLADNQHLDLAIRAPEDADNARITLLEPLRHRYFDACPICGDPAESDEHLPPRRMGGVVMTRTCLACNNGFGSLIETDLIDWFENAITLPNARSRGVRGYRSLGRLLLRTAPTGEFALLIDGSAHPDIEAMLRSGEIDLQAHLPDRNRYSIALLKQAYLAACLCYDVPAGPAADRVRKELIAARNARHKKDVPVSEVAAGLIICRRYDTVGIPMEPVMRAVLHEPEADIEGVLLAGRIFVSWMSYLGADTPDQTENQLSRTLSIGEPQQAVITTTSP
ncbi:hypothetical protein [Actinoplanes sp. RD1]|uniref:hypothetical protein n=1 Tax=Actinoplanes sp. RD1 TaxID=3064538 RepID=UPI002741C1F8|nr:hypothetical protein [Actinoplanes sp. RD1]